MVPKQNNESRNARSHPSENAKKKWVWWFNQPTPIDRFTGWLVTWTALLFIATVGSAYVLLQTDNTLHNTLIETKKAADAATVAANATVEAAKAAQDAAKTSKDAMVAAYRAWLAPRGIEFTGEVKAGSPIRYRVFYQNAGNQPALKVFHARAQRVSELPPVRENWDTVVGPSEDLCPDAATRRFGPTLFPSAEKGLFTSEQVFVVNDDVASGKKLFTLIGCFAYETFAAVHTSSYCFYLKPAQGVGTGAESPWEFRPCSNGNDAN
jgi:hypothetical protein